MKNKWLILLLPITFFLGTCAVFYFLSKEIKDYNYSLNNYIETEGTFLKYNQEKNNDNETINRAIYEYEANGFTFEAKAKTSGYISDSENKIVIRYNPENISEYNLTTNSEIIMYYIIIVLFIISIFASSKIAYQIITGKKTNIQIDPTMTNIIENPAMNKIIEVSNTVEDLSMKYNDKINKAKLYIATIIYSIMVIIVISAITYFNIDAFKVYSNNYQLVLANLKDYNEETENNIKIYKSNYIYIVNDKEYEYIIEATYYNTSEIKDTVEIHYNIDNPSDYTAYNPDNLLISIGGGIFFISFLTIIIYINYKKFNY